ncbi:MAG: metal-sensing transcriptional repressor [Spirochaetes bacterium]|nr:metal-sensing transcriptional repressor [Spirochaetota bacterium]
MEDQKQNHKQTKAVINRLSRIEGHIRSIKAMVEEGRNCTDVLTQISAVRSAVNNVGRVILEDHLESCLLYGHSNMEDDEIIAEIREAIDLFL